MHYSKLFLNFKDSDLVNFAPAKKGCTGENRMRKAFFVRTLRRTLHLLNPLDKNSREVETGNGSYIIGFNFYDLEIKE